MSHNGNALGTTLDDIGNPKPPKDLIQQPSGKMKAARAIPDILAILAGVDRKYHAVIFESIVNLDMAEKGNEKSVQEISHDLNDLAKQREEWDREEKPNGRRRWFS